MPNIYITNLLQIFYIKLSFHTIYETKFVQNNNRKKLINDISNVLNGQIVGSEKRNVGHKSIHDKYETKNRFEETSIHLRTILFVKSKLSFGKDTISNEIISVLTVSYCFNSLDNCTDW